MTIKAPQQQHKAALSPTTSAGPPAASGSAAHGLASRQSAVHTGSYLQAANTCSMQQGQHARLCTAAKARMVHPFVTDPPNTSQTASSYRAHRQGARGRAPAELHMPPVAVCASVTLSPAIHPAGHPTRPPSKIPATTPQLAHLEPITQ